MSQEKCLNLANCQPSTVPCVLYRDACLLVLDKPAGIAVHAGSKRTTALDQYFDLLRFGLPNPPALAHRLDKETSGCLILGRHTKALRQLGYLFANGKVEKTYWAFVKGRPPLDEGCIDLPLAPQSNKTYHWHMKVDQAGKPAITFYRLLSAQDGWSWLELTPKTGRTHQLRVHCEALGCPILGDRIYGNAQASEQLHLHARSVTIPFYPRKSPIVVEAPSPLHMVIPS